MAAPKKQDIETVAGETEEARAHIIKLGGELHEAEEQLKLAEQRLQSEQATHAQQLQRLNDIIAVMQSSPKETAPGEGTPEHALRQVISTFQVVAEGSPAVNLRHTVHNVAGPLTSEGRAKFKSFLSRLRSAAEAAEQEGAALTV